MNNLLMTGFSVLIGMATAGTVWYMWGLSANIRTLHKNKKLKLQAEASSDEDDESGD